MKKILLIIFTIILILSVNVLAVDIDIGEAAINRSGIATSGETYINAGAVANASGKVTTIEIYSYNNLTNCEVAIFYRPDPDGFPNDFSTRDSVLIGNVEKGALRSFAVDLDVEIGDMIGVHTTNNIDKDSSGYDGIWHFAADYIPCTNEHFYWLAGDAVSLHGIGATVAVGWPHKWNTQTISKWNTKEFTKWNGLE